MKLTWQRRKRIVEIVKAFSIYILLVGLTASFTLNFLFFRDFQNVGTTEKEAIRDVQVRYMEREVPYFFDNENNRWEWCTVTGYSANDSLQGTNNIVAAGFDLNEINVQNLPIVASNCIPLYTIIEIEGLGSYIVLDTGLGYKTDYGWEDDIWVDILFDDKQEAKDFGIQKLKVRVITVYKLAEK